jgi:hypothetical protein
MKTTILMAAALAAATLLAAGLTVLPSSVQEAQANPCSIGEGNGPSGDLDADFECEFNGHIEIIIESGGPDMTAPSVVTATP